MRWVRMTEGKPLRFHYFGTCVECIWECEVHKTIFSIIFNKKYNHVLVSGIWAAYGVYIRLCWLVWKPYFIRLFIKLYPNLYRDGFLKWDSLVHFCVIGWVFNVWILILNNSWLLFTIRNYIWSNYSGASSECHSCKC